MMMMMMVKTTMTGVKLETIQVMTTIEYLQITSWNIMLHKHVNKIISIRCLYCFR